MTRRFRIATILAAATCAAPLAAAPTVLAMLDGLESGLWELRFRDGKTAVQRICLRNGRQLIQLRHPGASCERLVLTDQPGEVTVQYTCRGNGYGRTQIRHESSRLVQVDSQGLAAGLPFAFTAEARRVGSCSS